MLFGLALLLSGWVAGCGGGQSDNAGSPQALAQDQAVTAATDLVQTPRVGMGIGGLSYWDRSFAMADVGRQAQIRSLSSDWAYITGDANGNPMQNFRLIYSAAKIAAGTYKLIFSGRATVSAGGAGTVQNKIYNASTNVTTADIVLPVDATGHVWLEFKDTYRNANSASGDGLTNIHLWRPGYPTDGSALFTTEFIAAMKKFKILRGMDLVNANSNPQVTWKERTRPSFFGTTGINGQSWELLVAMANTANRDVWLNVPAKANDEYIAKLAQLVKFGSDGDQPYTSVRDRPVHAPLNPGLKVYLEYGNEIWNSAPGFLGFRWALELANTYKSDLTHPIAFDGAQTDQFIAQRRWIAYRSSVISQTFRNVFGDKAMMTTVRPILAGQAGNGNVYLSIGLQWAQSFYGQVRTIAPFNKTVRKPSDIWYGGGGAAYYLSTVDPTDTSTATMDSYFASLPTPAFSYASIADSIWTHGYGLKYVAYEGGPGPGGSALGSISNANISPVYNNDPRMKERMLLAQNIWDQAGGDELVYYVYSSSAPWSFTNELVQQVVSDTSSVKLQAIDAINALPQAAVTLGSVVPASIYLKDPASSTIGSDGASWALGGTVYLLRPGAVHPSPYILLPIRTATAGTYQISLKVPNKVTGSVKLYVNGNSHGAINLTLDSTGTTTVSAKVAASLPAGLSVLRLEAPAASGDIFVKNVVVE